MSRLTRGIFGRKPTQAGASDITSLDTQYVASVAGTWPSTTSSTEFIAAESFIYTDVGFISYKKLGDGLYYPGLFVDTAPTSDYYSSADANSYFGSVADVSVAKGGTHVAVIINTRSNPTLYNLFIWKKAPAGYASPWQYVSVLTTITTSSTSSGPWAVAFHPSGNYLAYGLYTTNAVQKLFLMSRSGDTFTLLSNPPDVAASGYINCMEWNPDGTSLAVGISVSPYIVIYNFSAGTLTKLSNPATLPTSIIYSVKWNHDGSSLAVSQGTSTGFIVYNRSGNTFTAIGGTPMGTVGTNRAGSISWNNNGTLLAIANFTNGISVYSRSGDSFSSVSVPSPWNVGDANYGNSSGYAQVAFNPNGTELLIGAASMLEMWLVNGTSITRPSSSPIGAFVGRPGGATSSSGFSSRMGTTFGTGTATAFSPTSVLRWVPPA